MTRHCNSHFKRSDQPMRAIIPCYNASLRLLRVFLEPMHRVLWRMLKLLVICRAFKSVKEMPR